MGFRARKAAQACEDGPRVSLSRDVGVLVVAKDGHAQLPFLSLSRENLVESEIDKPAEEVHEGVDGICGAEMQDARS